MAGGDYLRLREASFQPCNDEVQGRPVIDRVALAPFMGVQWLASRVVDDEMRIALHAVDPAAAEQRQRPGRIHRVGAELQAGGPGVENDDGLAHDRSLRSFGEQDGGIDIDATIGTAAPSQCNTAARLAAALAPEGGRDMAGAARFSIGTASTCDSRARRSSPAAVGGSPAPTIARTCFSSSFRASVPGTRDGSTSTARSGSSWSTKNWSRTSTLNSARDSCMSCWRATFNASAQRWSSIRSAAATYSTARVSASANPPD